MGTGSVATLTMVLTKTVSGDGACPLFAAAVK